MEDIHDIKGPLELSFNYLPLIILFTVLILVLITLLYFSLKKRKELPPPEPEATTETKLSAREIALLELDKLKKEGLIEANKTDIFYNRLTEILKNYFSSRYAISTEPQTSTEIILQLKLLQMDYDFVRQAELCLKDLDFAKYSVYKNTVKDMNESIDLFYGLFKLDSRTEKEQPSINLNKN